MPAEPAEIVYPFADCPEPDACRQRGPCPYCAARSHPYTVDAVLVGAEPYPCTICGKGREAHA